SEQISQMTDVSDEHNQKLNEIRQEIITVQATEQKTAQQLDQVRNSAQRLRGQQASLEALQQTALGQRNNPVTAWLKEHNLDKEPRLGQCVEVAAGWEHAAEKVLGINLQAVCVDNLSDVTGVIDDLKAGS